MLRFVLFLLCVSLVNCSADASLEVATGTEDASDSATIAVGDMVGKNEELIGNEEVYCETRYINFGEDLTSQKEMALPSYYTRYDCHMSQLTCKFHEDNVVSTNESDLSFDSCQRRCSESPECKFFFSRWYNTCTLFKSCDETNLRIVRDTGCTMRKIQVCAGSEVDVGADLTMLDDSNLIAMAKLAEKAERYDDMVAAMKTLAERAGAPFTEDQRNLLSNAYKNVVGDRRSAWRVVSSIEAKEASEGTDTTLTREYKSEIQKEILDLTHEVLNLIDRYLLRSTQDDEASIFYYKMKGDYLRYSVEVYAPSDNRANLANAAENAYKEAMDAAAILPSTHPLRLGLQLNYSVFKYEIRDDVEGACRLASQAFDDAVSELDSIEEESYKESTLLMQLIRDNLTLWTSSSEEQDEPQTENEVAETLVTTRRFFSNMSQLNNVMVLLIPIILASGYYMGKKNVRDAPYIELLDI